MVEENRLRIDVVHSEVAACSAAESASFGSALDDELFDWCAAEGTVVVRF